MVKYLIDGQQVEPSCLDEKSTTPLHLASKSGHLHVIKFLIGEKKCDPAPIDVFGKTPIDMANMYGKAEICLYLLSKGGGTGFSQYMYLKIESLKSCLPLCPRVKIFVTGNSGSGKTTLVKALQNETSIMGRFVNVRDAPPDTAGIIPHEFTSAKFGEVRNHL